MDESLGVAFVSSGTCGAFYILISENLNCCRACILLFLKISVKANEKRITFLLHDLVSKIFFLCMRYFLYYTIPSHGRLEWLLKILLVCLYIYTILCVCVHVYVCTLTNLLSASAPLGRG